MINAIRSHFAALKASRAYGRAVKAQHVGDSRSALDAGRSALAQVSSPFVNRDKPWIGTLVMLSVLLVEHHAHELGEPGASLQDLQFAWRFLRGLGEGPGGPDPKDRLNIQYLESRIAHLQAAEHS